jgi:hypothetical protein
LGLLRTLLLGLLLLFLFHFLLSSVLICFLLYVGSINVLVPYTFFLLYNVLAPYVLTYRWCTVFFSQRLNEPGGSSAPSLTFDDDFRLFLRGDLRLLDLKFGRASRSPGRKNFCLLIEIRCLVVLFLGLVSLGAGDTLIFVRFRQLVKTDSPRAWDRDSCTVI